MEERQSKEWKNGRDVVQRVEELKRGRVKSGKMEERQSNKWKNRRQVGQREQNKVG